MSGFSGGVRGGPGPVLLPTDPRVPADGARHPPPLPALHYQGQSYLGFQML